MSRPRAKIMADVETLLAAAPVAIWDVKETPYAPSGEEAQVRTLGGRLVATFSDPDDARLAVNAVKLLRELAGLS